MYPVIRLGWQFWKHRNSPTLGFNDIHESQHRIWLSDIDIFWELNNGRALTLYDSGRILLGRRTGLWAALKANGWGMTVAGSTVRYRRRLRLFDQVTMRSRGIGWDDRFLYIEQSMWRKDGECAGHVLLRMAVTGKSGIVPPIEIAKAMNKAAHNAPLPDWAKAWADAEAKRPWPPMFDDN